MPVREEQVSELTIAWPAMRRAVVRMGEALASRGVLANNDDVFFLTRAEVITTMRSMLAAAIDVDLGARHAPTS